MEKTAKVARSAPCPCGSGKKFKRCCGQSPRDYLPCDYPECPVRIPANLHDGHGIQKLCGALIMVDRGIRRALCPEHAEELLRLHPELQSCIR